MAEGFYLLGLVILLITRPGHCQSNSACSAANDKPMDPEESPYSDRKDWKQQWHPLTDEKDKFVDLMFLVDGSGSVTSENFATVMRWIGSMSSRFDITTGKFQIGVVQYSHWYRMRKVDDQKLVRTEIELGSFSDISPFKARLETVELMGYTTYTGFAINKTVKEDFHNSKNYPNSTKIMVLLTDGTSQDSVIESANYARQEKVIIFAVGIGNGADINELRAIATGDPFENHRIYVLSDFDELPMITDSLRSEIKSYYVSYVCPPLPVPYHGSMQCTKANEVGSVCTLKCDYGDFQLFGPDKNSCHVSWQGVIDWWPQNSGLCGVCMEKFDLLVILDSSSSVSREPFVVAKKFSLALVDAMRIGVNDVQVACIRYYGAVQPEFNYDEYTTKEKLQQAFRDIQYCGSGTNTGKALQYAINKQFSSSSGRRKQVPHITLLITDGTANDDVIEPAAQLKKISTVFAFGIRGANLNEIRRISSNTYVREFDRILPDYNELLNTSLVRLLLQNFCKSAEDIRNTFCDVGELPANVTCGNGETTKEKKPVGTQCTLHCSAGYRTRGKSSALCAYDGKWKRKNWKCVEKDCDAPTNDNKVVPLCQDGYKIDTLCNLKCKPGYDIIPPADRSKCEMFGNRTISCLLSCERRKGGSPTWDSNPISCKETGFCRPNTCGKGQCIIKDEEFFCSCDPGFAGVFCESEINECESVNCHNGTCWDKVNDYHCHCSRGFKGTHCEININECSSNPCQNRGKCHDEIASYTCHCPKGFTGRNCEININECASNPCKNNGTCRDGAGYYKCECIKGFTGESCEENIDDCATAVCNETGTKRCVDLIRDYKCLCRPGWKGTACHTDIDECKEKMYPCGKAGKCSNTEGSYSCICNIGYTGPQCGSLIDYCKPWLCKNGGNCQNYIGSYRCECREGYTGQNCARNVNDCVNNACKYGVCKDGVNNYTCECHEGYHGHFCQYDTNECEPNPCRNGDCQQDKPNSYKCKCWSGFKGRNCDEDVNECDLSENRCNGRGECINIRGGFSCKCDPGFDGNHCEHNIDECMSHDCKNDGKCIDEINGYSCICTDGFTGKLCETDIDYCEPNPCINNGTCLLLEKSYRCHCIHGYEGVHCENDIDECKTEPPLCENEATCINEKGRFKCQCKTGFGGFLCTEKLCDRPKQISQEGEMNCTNSNLPGSRCNITCPQRMRLKHHTHALRVKTVARIQLSCTEDRTWNNSGAYLSGELMEWQCENITCGPLERLSVGGFLPFQQINSSVRVDERAHHINCTDGENVGSICRLKCHKYYSLQGHLERKCLPTGSWTGSRWRCVQRKCPNKLPPVRNGSYVCGDHSRPGSVCNVICDPGFVRDEVKLGRIICDEVNGQMSWKRVGTRGSVCRSSKCEASLNLASLHFNESSFLSVRRYPHRDILERKNSKEGKSECNAKAIFAINMTRSEEVTMQLWFGDTVAGYHTVISTNGTTNGHDTYRHSEEFLISGVGRHLSSSGFGRRPSRPNNRLMTVKILPVIVFPNSIATMTLTFDRWSWNSTGGNWAGELSNGDPSEWYMVYLGLNRVPNMQPYYDHYRNGTGLCHVCFIRNKPHL